MYCPYCHKYTALSVVPAEYDDSRGNSRYTAALWKDARGNKWWIGVCNGCQSPNAVPTEKTLFFNQKKVEFCHGD